MAEFDFGNVSVETDELPKRAGGRTRKIQDNPFVAPVQESYDTETGRAVKVPKSAVKDAERLIRQAAADLGLGVRIVYSMDPKSEEFAKAANNKMIKISFQGQVKRKYAPRKNGAVTVTQAADTPQS